MDSSQLCVVSAFQRESAHVIAKQTPTIRIQWLEIKLYNICKKTPPNRTNSEQRRNKKEVRLDIVSIVARILMNLNLKLVPYFNIIQESLNLIFKIIKHCFVNIREMKRLNSNLKYISVLLRNTHKMLVSCLVSVVSPPYGEKSDSLLSHIQTS